MTTTDDGARERGHDWRFRDPGELGRWLVLLLGALALLDAVAIAQGLAELRLLDRVIAGDPPSLAEWNASDGRGLAIGGLQSVGFLAGAVVFIVWLRRCYRNLPTLGARRLRFGSAWTVWAWLVPVLGLWRPKQIANDVWRGSSGRAVGVATPVPRVMTAWWLMFLASVWGTNVALRLAVDSQTAQDLREATLAYIVSDALDIAAAVLAIVVVRTITRLQAGPALGSAPVASPATA